MRSPLLYSSFVLYVALISAGVQSLELTSQPSLSLDATHNDNIRLTPDNPISISGTEAGVGLDSRVASETFRTELNLDLLFNNYNRSEYSSDDQYLDLIIEKDFERQNIGLDANFTRDSTRTSELESTGDVGFAAERREYLKVEPYWSYRITDTDTIELRVSREKTDYVEGQYTNYDYDKASASWFTVLSDALTLQLQVLGSHTEYAERETGLGTTYSSETDKVEVSIGGTYQVAENFQLSGLMGSAETEQDYVVEDPLNVCSIFALVICSFEDFSGRSATANITAAWTGERSEFSLSYMISDQPSNKGYEVESERAIANLRYRLTELSRIDFKVLYGSINALDGDVSGADPNNPNRDFVNANLIYSHKLTPSWRLSANGGYRWQEREIALDEAEAFFVKLGVSYEPTKIFW